MEGYKYNLPSHRSTSVIEGTPSTEGFRRIFNVHAVIYACHALRQCDSTGSRMPLFPVKFPVQIYLWLSKMCNQGMQVDLFQCLQGVGPRRQARKHLPLMPSSTLNISQWLGASSLPGLLIPGKRNWRFGWTGSQAPPSRCLSCMPDCSTAAHMGVACA